MATASRPSTDTSPALLSLQGRKSNGARSLATWGQAGALPVRTFITKSESEILRSIRTSTYARRWISWPALRPRRPRSGIELFYSSNQTFNFFTGQRCEREYALRCKQGNPLAGVQYENPTFHRAR